MCVRIVTAGEDERTGVFVHGEVVELQLAFCVDGHPEGDRDYPYKLNQKLSP